MGTPKVDMNKVKDALKKAKQKADKRGITWYKPEDGENVVRILPPWSGEGVFAKESGYHYGVASDRALACPKVCKNLPCPICEAVSDLFKSRKSDDLNLAKRIGVKTRYFYNVLDRVAKDGKVYVYGSGSMVYEKILSIFGDNDYGDITDVQNGYDIKIIKSGEGIETKYEVRPVKNSSAVIKWEEKRKKLHDLDALVESDMLSYNALKAILEGAEPPAEDEDEAEEADEKKGSKATTKASKKDEEEEEEAEEKEDAETEDVSKDKASEEEEEEESEEEDEPKKGSKSAKASSKKDEEEEESESEEEDEGKSDKEESSEEEEEEEDEPKSKKSKKDDDKDESEGGEKDEEVKSALDRLRKMKKR